jgi:hypothetical protein
MLPLLAFCFLLLRVALLHFAGNYSADQAASMAAEAAKKAANASRRGIFGSAAERFSSSSACGANNPVAAAASCIAASSGGCSPLGPGAYEVDCGVARHAAAAAARPSPVSTQLMMAVLQHNA